MWLNIYLCLIFRFRILKTHIFFIKKIAFWGKLCYIHKKIVIIKNHNTVRKY